MWRARRRRRKFRTAAVEKGWPWQGLTHSRRACFTLRYVYTHTHTHSGHVTVFTVTWTHSSIHSGAPWWIHVRLENILKCFLLLYQFTAINHYELAIIISKSNYCTKFQDHNQISNSHHATSAEGQHGQSGNHQASSCQAHLLPFFPHVTKHAATTTASRVNWTGDSEQVERKD